MLVLFAVRRLATELGELLLGELLLLLVLLVVVVGLLVEVAFDRGRGESHRGSGSTKLLEALGLNGEAAAGGGIVECPPQERETHHAKRHR